MMVSTPKQKDAMLDSLYPHLNKQTAIPNKDNPASQPMGLL